MSRRLINFFWILALPTSFAWAVITYLRRRFYPSFLKYQSRGKVICVGNIHSGGSGKTPLVLEILERYSRKNPVLLSRGYRGKFSAQGARVDTQSLAGAANYGDEPWMLSQRTSAPIYIAKKRVKGIRQIENDFPGSFTLLDDGLQHLALKRDLDIVCINTDKNPTESFCIPMGELREPFSALDQLPSSSAMIVLIPGSKPEQSMEWKNLISQNFGTLPLFEAVPVLAGLFNGSEPVNETGSWLGFCGIAEPQRFIADFYRFCPSGSYLRSFPDHCPYSDAELDDLIEAGKSQKNSIPGFVTTDKDWYKLKDRFDKRGIRLLSLRIRYDLPEGFWKLLSGVIDGKGGEC